MTDKRPIGYIDAEIAPFVEALRSGGVETYESCQGGEGHSFPEPTIRFFGNVGAGFHALSVAMTHRLPVSTLRRTWRVIDGEPVGPTWEMPFVTPKEQQHD